MFYYLLHVPLIHAMGEFYGRFGPKFCESWNLPIDYVHSLPVVYVAWIVVLILLYPPCHWWAGVKQRYRSAWLSYL